MADQPDQADQPAAPQVDVNQLLQDFTDAIQAIAANQAALAALAAANAGGGAAGVAPPAAGPFLLTGYEGGELDTTSRVGQSLYSKGSAVLSTKFDGKMEQLHLFVAAVKERADECCWASATHGILTVMQDGQTYRVLEDYGVITKVTMVNARNGRNAGGTNRAKQNSRMMYKAVLESLEGFPKTSIISSLPEIGQDGPLLFYTIVRATYTATLTHAQNAREQLQTLHPKKFAYDIAKVNAHIRLLIQQVKSGTPLGTPLPNPEIVLHLLATYKRIQAPRDWITHIEYLGNRISEDPAQANQPDDLMNKAEAKYNELKDNSAWKPSDKSVDQQFIAMIASMTDKNKSKESDGKGKGKGKGKGSPNPKKQKKSDRKEPPFKDAKGKVGDTKEWEGKTWYFCPNEHKGGHWGTHHPDKCRLNDTSSGSGSGSSKNKDKNAKSKQSVQVNEKALTAIQEVIDTAKDDGDYSAALSALTALFSNE